MAGVVYLVSRGQEQNVNGQWLDRFIQSNGRGIRYIGYGVLAAVSIYVLVPSISSLIIGKDMFSSHSKRSDRTTTGLINNKNDCFANSSVQALSALPRLTTYLNDILSQASQMVCHLEKDDDTSEEVPKVREPSPAPSAPPSINKSPEELEQQHQEHAHHHNHLTPPQHQTEGATPKAELEQNPLDMHVSSMVNMSTNRPGLPELKSTNTITTLKDEEDNGDETPEMSVKREASGGEDSGDTPVDGSNLPKLPLHRSLASMLEQLQRPITAPRHLSVWPLLHSLEVIFNARISSGQNDAHELTQVILETLQKENNKVREFVKNRELPINIPEIPFRGKSADHLVCTACRNSSKVRVTQFNMLPLAVPQAISAKLAEMVSDNQVESIEGYSCLTCKVGKILENEKGRDPSRYETTEQNILASLTKAFPNLTINDDLSEDLMNYINGYNRDGLVTSQLKSTIVKKNVVVDTPQVLLIHLSRSMFNGTSYTRNPCAVNFDEILHLQEQVIQNDRCVGINNVTYQLKAIVKHSGSHSQGHYQCYRHKPDLVKDIDTHAVINRTPVIDVNLINIHDPQDSKEAAATEMMEPPPVKQTCDSPSNLSSTSLSGSTDLSNTNDQNDSEDYVLDNDDSSKVSRKPSAFRKITNFLSRRSSVSNPSLDTPDASESENVSRGRRSTASRNTGDRSRTSSAVRNSNNPRESSVASRQGRSRSRANSTSSVQSPRSRASSVSSDRSSSDLSAVTSSESNNYGTTTSASDTDSISGADPMTRKRHLKRIKSVLKYPYWSISDTVVHEAKPEEVLNEHKYVYMLFYERVSA
ncbi:hypothetical protein ZYGR_0AK01670 [Zygosaccharomyces rouxii]|uniref:USP domain-containing protein n=1 Tax=Zygosaccharomyces rouxii TaxID=4956 RepID=A0A1Q3ADF8_ZYGRO|nr:hypothetical protein ZYGR_0AK01670 [Zygosaccharomyces rouxii]